MMAAFFCKTAFTDINKDGEGYKGGFDDYLLSNL